MNSWHHARRIARAVLRRRKRLLILSLATSAVLLIPPAYYLSKEPPRHRATATILLEARPDRVPLFPEFSPFRAVPVQLAILKSRSVAEGVLEVLDRQAVDDLLESPFYVDYVAMLRNTYMRLRGVEPELASRTRRALGELRNGRVRFTMMHESIVEITAEASTPQIAVDIANAYIEVLLARTRSFNVDDARASREFLEQQLAEVKKSLRSTEEALRAFNTSHGGIRVQEKNQLALARLGHVETALAEVESNRKMMQTRVQALREKVEAEKRQPSVPAPGAPAPPLPAEIQRLRAQLVQLESALLDQLTKFTEQHPRIVILRDRIAEVQRRLGDAVKDTSPATPAPAAVPPAERVNFSEQLVALEANYHALGAREDALRKQAEGLRQSLSGMTGSELDYTRLNREVESNRNLHALLADKLAAARIREQGEMKVVKVIDAPRYPTPISGKKRLHFLALAAMGTLAIGAGVPAAVEWLRRTVDTEEDVEIATGLPVLALLPDMRTRPPRLLSTAETRQLKRVDDVFIFSEAIRNLRVNIQLAQHTGEAARRILVTSGLPGEGKSTLVMNLGMAFGEAGYRVVLADTDFQRPTLHRVLKVAPSAPGVSDALEASSKIGDTLVPVGDRMWMAPRGGSFLPKARGLLATKRLRLVVDEMADHADMVLLDSSPVQLIPDNLFLAAAVDVVIVVVRAGSTTYRDLMKTKRLLEGVGAHVLGVVINGMPSASLYRQYARYYRTYAKKDGA